MESTSGICSLWTYFQGSIPETQPVQLTTEVLSPDQRGPCTEPHLLVWILQAEMRSCTSSGSVATLTSDRALAQAEELTSHMNENTTVTMKSWRGEATKTWKNERMLLCIFHYWQIIIWIIIILENVQKCPELITKLQGNICVVLLRLLFHS